MVSVNNIQVYYKVKAFCFFYFTFYFTYFFKLKEELHEYPDFWHE